MIKVIPLVNVGDQKQLMLMATFSSCFIKKPRCSTLQLHFCLARQKNKRNNIHHYFRSFACME
jgi:hypothetical protein